MPLPQGCKCPVAVEEQQRAEFAGRIAKERPLGSLPWSSLYAPTCRAELSVSSKPPRATRQPDHRSQVGSNESALPTPRPLGSSPRSERALVQFRFARLQNHDQTARVRRARNLDRASAPDGDPRE